MAHIITDPMGATITIDGRSLMNFVGSAYLGLGNDERIKSAACDALMAHGVSNSQPLRYGLINSEWLDAEAAACAYFGAEAAHYCPSGWMVGPLALSALTPRFDNLFIDEQCHYSLCHGAAAQALPLLTFSSDDLNALDEALSKAKRSLIVVDGAGGGVGAVAPLPALLDLAEKHDGAIFVDDAHAAGALGPNGRGTADHYGIASSRVFSGASMTKAFSAAGGILYGNQSFINDVKASPINQSMNLGMLAGGAATAMALHVAAQEPWRRQTACDHAATLRERLRDLGVSPVETPMPIVSFAWGTKADMFALREHMMDAGIYLCHSDYNGTGPEGMIRCTLCADHTKDHLNTLIEALCPLI